MNLGQLKGLKDSLPSYVLGALMLLFFSSAANAVSRRIFEPHQFSDEKNACTRRLISSKSVTSFEAQELELRRMFSELRRRDPNTASTAASVYSDFVRENGFGQDTVGVFYIPRLAAEYASAALLTPEGIPLGFQFDRESNFLSFMRRGGAKLYAKMKYVALQLIPNERGSLFLGSAVSQAIGKLVGLRILDLSGHRLQPANINDLKSLTELLVLDLSRTQFGREHQQLAALGVIPKLRALDLSDNNVSDAALAELSPLRQLRSLRVSRNRLSRSSRRLFAHWPELRILDVSFSSPFVESHLENAPEDLEPMHPLIHLQVLRAAGGPLWGEGWGSVISKIPNLRVLDIGQPGSELPIEIAPGANLPDLEVFSMDHGKMGDQFVQSLGRSTRLRALNLRQAGLNDAAASELGHLTQLEALNLSWNNIGNTGAKALSVLPKLHTLQITSNQIGDSGARSLAKLPALATLDINNNQLTNRAVLALARAPALNEMQCRQQRLPRDSSRGSSLGPAPTRDAIARVESKGIRVSSVMRDPMSAVECMVDEMSDQIIDEIESEIAYY